MDGAGLAAEYLLDARAEPSEIGAVLASGANNAPPTTRHREREAATHVGRAAGSAPAHAGNWKDITLGHRSSHGAG